MDVKVDSGTHKSTTIHQMQEPWYRRLTLCVRGIYTVGYIERANRSCSFDHLFKSKNPVTCDGCSFDQLASTIFSRTEHMVAQFLVHLQLKVSVSRNTIYMHQGDPSFSFHQYVSGTLCSMTCKDCLFTILNVINCLLFALQDR